MLLLFRIMERVAPPIELMHLAADNPFARLGLLLDKRLVSLIVAVIPIPHIPSSLANLDDVYLFIKNKENINGNSHYIVQCIGKSK